jgi:SAM-dependent methyltransferase
MNDSGVKDREQAPADTEARYRREARDRKRDIRRHADAMAPQVRTWWARNRYYHDNDIEYLRYLIPEGSSVLDLGCGHGETLAALKPSRGIGVDFSEPMVARARGDHPGLDFIHADIEDPAFPDMVGPTPVDAILLCDTIGSLEDCQSTLESLHGLCNADTRIVVSYYSHLWEPVLQLGERLKLKMPQVTQNFLRKSDIENILRLAGYGLVKQEHRLLWPKRWLGLGPLINRYVAPLPGFRRLCLRHYTIARSMRQPRGTSPSVSVVVPCRNERGNIADVLARLPAFCQEMEVIFVEGHSEDGTLEEIHRAITAYDGPFRVSVAVQDGKGKADAVRKGFDLAQGDVLIILDADLTVAPEDLTKFYAAISTGQGEFINGTRLVYPMERQAMRFLNLVGNALFARMFSWLLNQRITDTLCGTKVLHRRHYERIRRGRAYFGDFDPFGDFDLLFGAAKLNLKFLEIPVRYASRSYGETQISRFRHGLLLMRMVIFAFRKLKAF